MFENSVTMHGIDAVTFASKFELADDNRYDEKAEKLTCRQALPDKESED